MKNTYYTYKKSGVNIRSANKLVKYISKISKKTNNTQSRLGFFSNIGSFGSAFDLSTMKLKDPIIVSSTDGVGTKIEIANHINKFDTIGIDLVAMCVNDLIVQGAKPIFFLDYIAMNKLKAKKIKKILGGIVKGCLQANCALVGGETAEMSGTYSKNKFDLAGFAVGAVEKKNLLIKSKIRLNNILLAIPSSGVHSNGYSLIRKILNKKKINLNRSFPLYPKLKLELIKPTKIYVKEIVELNRKKLINGCANITGGGIIDNLPRIMPEGYTINVDLNKIKVPQIFKWIKKNKVKDNEMLKTFNCGVGFCLIVDKKNAKKVKTFFTKKYQPYEIGFVSEGNIRLNIYGKIKW